MNILASVKKLFHIHEDIRDNENRISQNGTEDSCSVQPAPENCEAGLPPVEDGWPGVVEYLQTGFYDFTMEKGVIGFWLDPENRWVQLGHEMFSSVAGAEALYEKRMEELRADTKGSRLKTRLEKLKQGEDVEAYGTQLALPNLDSAVSEAIADATPAEEDNRNAGRKPFPFRLAFGILVAQSILGIPDRGICRLVSESPYLQWFLGFTSFSIGNTVDPSNLVHFRERLDITTMKEINAIVYRHRNASEDYMSAAKAAVGDTAEREAHGKETVNDTSAGSMQDGSDAQPGDDTGAAGHTTEVSGTLVLDATCAPTSIRYPQDFSLLNEGRMDLEQIINRLCHEHDFEKPRTYVRTLQKEAQGLSKKKKKSAEHIRRVIRLELNAIKRNLEYIDGFLSKSESVELTSKEIEQVQVIRAVYAQQRYMYEQKTHVVSNRIVSISQPFVRPISRGKVNKPTEFGPKYDIAVDENGFSWITSFSFDNFIETSHLQKAVEDYKKKTGHYPQRVLADQIYRTKDNRKYCKAKGIRISGPPLGRKPGDEDTLKELVAVEKRDMVDRITVERHFSRQKRCFGINAIVEKTEATIGHAVGMAVFLDNMVPADF